MPAGVAKIAVSAATYWIDKPYDYLIPEEMREQAVPGVRVSVPFSKGNRRCEGIILAVAENSEYEKLKAITEVLDPRPVLTPEQIKLALFMRERFFCTVYDAVKAILPAGLWFNEEGKRRAKDKTVEVARLSVTSEDASVIADNKRRRSPKQAAILDLLCSFEMLPVRDILNHTGASRQVLKGLVNLELVELFQREVYRRPDVYTDEIQPVPELNGEQEKAYQGLSRLAASGRASVALLFGVTGSGKTSVYIHLINDSLKKGKSAILLVPEIALTPQMLHTFSSHFGDEIAVLHSSLSTGERYDEWKRIKSGKARVVIGTRSAIFAPVSDLGIIIIDEEQEETYKSENAPRYNARDIAKYLCSKAGCLLLLGSATPDISSRYSAETGKYSMFTLSERYNDMQLPEVKIVDMKRELRRGNGGDISSFLRDELAANIEKGDQSILFINRLMCHYCGYSRRVDEACPDCGGTLKYVGTGTQHVEEQLHELFPGVGVLRMDTDTVTPVGSHEKLFDRFRNENIPIMVGTQMVTKGLNFENVTLVGVISADQSLYAGDYRAGERTFSLITQVVGRSGRGAKPGRAVIQTFTPENQTIKQAAMQDYEAFYQSEIQLRRLQNAPPLCDLFSVTASGADEVQVIKTAQYIRKWLSELLCDSAGTVVLGPAPLSVVKVNNRYRYRVNICCTASGSIRKIISHVVTECCKDKRFKGVSVYADNDPTE